MLISDFLTCRLRVSEIQYTLSKQTPNQLVVINCLVVSPFAFGNRKLSQFEGLFGFFFWQVSCRLAGLTCPRSCACETPREGEAEWVYTTNTSFTSFKFLSFLSRSLSVTTKHLNSLLPGTLNSNKAEYTISPFEKELLLSLDKLY